MRNRTTPRVDLYQVPVRAPDPRATVLAVALGRLHIRGINGHAGAVRYGYPAPGTRYKYAGYADPPQLFLGYSPRKVAAGAFRGRPGHLPSANSANPGLSALQRSMATVTAQQMGGA